ncbi:hypothetical protein T439DRAFT_327231 [Meredithblackwellia eburnea MCA 4105]
MNESRLSSSNNFSLMPHQGHLPPELVYNIFRSLTLPSFIEDGEDWYGNMAVEKYNQDLLNFALVCRSWSGPALDVLYEELVVQWTPRTGVPLLRLYEGSKANLRSIRGITSRFIIPGDWKANWRHDKWQPIRQGKAPYPNELSGLSRAEIKRLGEAEESRAWEEWAGLWRIEGDVDCDKEGQTSFWRFLQILKTPITRLRITGFRLPPVTDDPARLNPVFSNLRLFHGGSGRDISGTALSVIPLMTRLNSLNLWLESISRKQDPAQRLLTPLPLKHLTLRRFNTIFLFNHTRVLAHFCNFPPPELITLSIEFNYWKNPPLPALIRNLPTLRKLRVLRLGQVGLDLDLATALSSTLINLLQISPRHGSQHFHLLPPSIQYLEFLFENTWQQSGLGNEDLLNAFQENSNNIFRWQSVDRSILYNVKFTYAWMPKGFDEGPWEQAVMNIGPCFETLDCGLKVSILGRTIS